MMEIVIVVEGGLVQDVYASENTTVAVELIDLDEPSFATDEEVREYEAAHARAAELPNDSELTCVY